MKRDQNIIGWREVDDPDLRRRLQFSPDLSENRAGPLARGIAVHLCDEVTVLRKALREVVQSCDEKFGCRQFDEHLSVSTVEVLAEMEL